MKFKCGLTDEEEAERRLGLEKQAIKEGQWWTTWHRRFAWFPKTIKPGRCVWLEEYEERLTSVWVYTEHWYVYFHHQYVKSTPFLYDVREWDWSRAKYEYREV